MSDTREVRYVRNRLCKASDLMSEVFVKCEEMDKENKTLKKQLDRAIWWLNEIVTNHRHTPISTAEMALKEIEELNNVSR